MTSKSSFSAAEWTQITNAPYWVYAAMATVDGRQAILAKRKESKAMDAAMDKKPNNPFVRAVAGDIPEDTPKEMRRAKFTDAINALSKVGDILDDKADPADMDAYNNYLLGLAKAVAQAAGEGAFGMGDKTSDDEAEAIAAITNALQATAKDKSERKAAARAADAAEKAKVRTAARTRRESAANKARAEREAAEKQAERQARFKAAREKQEAERKRQQEMAAKREKTIVAARERAEKERLEEAAAEAKERQQERLEARKERAMAAKQAAADAAMWLGEHTVVSGDTLSGLAQKYYGSATRDKWMAIYEANKETIGDNPSLIRVGQTFKIPKLG